MPPIYETTELNTELLVAGNSVTAQKTAADGTYYAGQLLGRVDATGVYAPYASGASDGTENIRAVSMSDLVVTSDNILPVYITGSELQQRGIVDASGDKLTMTSAIIESAQDAGIVLKK